MSRFWRLLAIIGPGILVAATGVGTADIATGAISGSKLGLGILWAVLVGAFLKFLLDEGLARWQLVTGETLLEGCVAKFGRPAQAIFLIYLLFWSFFVAAALMGGTGVTLYAVVDETSRVLSGASLAQHVSVHNTQLADNLPYAGKVIGGVLQSIVALVLVRRGGFRLFEKVMGACIAVMFVTVVATAVAVKPAWSAVARGMLLPTIPDIDGEGIQWMLALLGGIGGTVTVICYGYWIREAGREGPEQINVCRIDLAVGYLMTAVFGLAMVMIGSRIAVSGSGATLIVDLASKLDAELSPTYGGLSKLGKWGFLVGAWGAAFSSLLGVWQSVPYIFADFWCISVGRGGPRNAVDTNSRPYRFYLYCLATIPMLGLLGSFVAVQKVYSIVGAAFIPMLALVLLILNGRSDWIGRRYRNSIGTSLLLIATLLFFLFFGWYEVTGKIQS
jgi:Mn2+/Fe2+ NRAMP family transporter